MTRTLDTAAADRLTFAAEIQRRQHESALSELRDRMLSVQRALAALDIEGASPGDLRAIAHSLLSDAERVRRSVEGEAQRAAMMDLLLHLSS